MIILPQMAPPAAGGSAAWSLAGTWDFSTGVAQVDFTNLGSYNELLIMARNISDGTTGTRQVLCSVDNGSTFFNSSGDYILISNAGAESNQASIGIHDTNSTAARSGSVHIHASGLNGVQKLCRALQRSAGNSDYLFVGSTSPINAIRINNSGGGNLTAGSIRVLGR